MPEPCGKNIPIAPRCGGAGDIPPWSAVTDWVALNRGFQYLIRKSSGSLHAAQQTARRIENDLLLLGALFDELADATCARCPRSCCRDARVWLDFKDLLFIHLSGQLPPAHQLRREMDERCRFLTPTGCCLPRLSRPWVCTWYVCPAQREVLSRDLIMGEVRLARLRRDVGRMRDRMEDEFVRAVRP
jgi:hypothetical protein